LSALGAGCGPKGLGNSAQALAWVALFLRVSPVRAPDNAGAIPIDRTQIQHDWLLRPFRAGRVDCNATQAKAWARIGVGTKVSFAPPSEPDWQISRIRLSSW